MGHAMSCNGVGVGGSADSVLGFSYEQCGTWFQDSLPANLPDAAKDGAAQQYLGSQCKVNYVEDSNIGDQFARHEEKSHGEPQINNNDVYNDAQTNQAQINDDVYNDDQTNQAQTNDVYSDAEITQAQTNDDAYNGQDQRDSSEVLLVQGAVRKSN